MKQGHHEHHGMDESKPHVQVNTFYSQGKVTVEVRDSQNNNVNLEETHEKNMHLIIVSADLENFLHVHPVENDAGDFEAELALSEGLYFAYVDINPVAMNHTIQPATLDVGEKNQLPEVDWLSIKKDDTHDKEEQGKKISFTHSEIRAQQPVSLHFDTHGEKLLPYLGALGHVVVLDSKGEKFLHVHPISEDSLEFEAVFPSPGIYKLWIEVRFEDTGVVAFPFIIEAV